MAYQMPSKICCRRCCTRRAREAISVLLHMSNSYDEQHDSTPLRIMQYNVGKTREVMDSILNHDDTRDYAILLLQEYSRTYKQNLPLLHGAWTAYEPTYQTETPPRAAIYINNSEIDIDKIEQLPIPHEDILAISIPAEPGPFNKPTLIVNLYNDSRTHSATEQLRNIFRHNVKINEYDIVLVCGDFNLHHALWNPPGYSAQEPQAQNVVETMMEANLKPLLPLGTITWMPPHRNPMASATAIDLVWGNENAEDILVKCHSVERTNDHASDHHPIEIALNLNPQKRPPPPPLMTTPKRIGISSRSNLNVSFRL